MRACLQRLAIAFVFYFTPIALLHAQSVITIDGSTGVAPLVAALAKTYEQQNPGTQIQIGKGLGTGARIRALDEGKIDIAMASHGLDVAAIQKQGMVVHEFAKVAVVFAVNETVPVAALTDAQVCAIYSGKAVNWRDVGGPDLAIAPLARPDSEVDTEVVFSRCPSEDLGQQITCLSASQSERDSRVAIAPTFGAGLSLYLGNWVAMTLEWRALPFAWNTSGTDESGSSKGDFPDGKIDSDDQLSHFNHMFSLGFAFYLPTEPGLSHMDEDE